MITSNAAAGESVTPVAAEGVRRRAFDDRFCRSPSQEFGHLILSDPVETKILMSHIMT
jgi:hypothetical protein